MEQLQFNGLEFSEMAWNQLEFSRADGATFPEVGRQRPLWINSDFQEWVDISGVSGGQIVATSPIFRVGDLVGKPIECIVLFGRDGTIDTSTPNSFGIISISKPDGSNIVYPNSPALTSNNRGAQYPFWYLISDVNTLYVNNGWASYLTNSYAALNSASAPSGSIALITNGDPDAEIVFNLSLKDDRTETGKVMITAGWGVYIYETV